MKPEIEHLRDTAQTTVRFSHQELHKVTNLIRTTTLAAFSHLMIAAEHIEIFQKLNFSDFSNSKRTLINSDKPMLTFQFYTY